MSAHVVPEHLFNPQVSDTSYSDLFFTMYEEMYYAAKDTFNFERVHELVQRSLKFQADTIPILVFNFDYLKIRDTAFKSHGYFEIDTVLDVYKDLNPPSLNPYLKKEVFAAGVPREMQYFKNIIYRIDPAFLKFCSRNAYKANTLEDFQLRIDFGDGNGWVYFDQSVVTNHAVVYPDSGNYAVTVQIVQGNAPNIIVINSAIFNKAVG